MTSKPASRSALAMTFAPRSCPSSPGLATSTRIGPVFSVITRIPKGSKTSPASPLRCAREPQKPVRIGRLGPPARALIRRRGHRSRQPAARRPRRRMRPRTSRVARRPSGRSVRRAWQRLRSQNRSRIPSGPEVRRVPEPARCARLRWKLPQREVRATSMPPSAPTTHEGAQLHRCACRWASRRPSPTSGRAADGTPAPTRTSWK